MWFGEGNARNVGVLNPFPPHTNNRAELGAVLLALRALPGDCEAVRLWTDSSYVCRGINEWVHGWRARGWRKKGGKELLNVDLWQALSQEMDRAGARGCTVEVKHVRGHAGVRGNEEADALARDGCRPMREGTVLSGVGALSAEEMREILED